jgi:hypothetical protein
MPATPQTADDTIDAAWYELSYQDAVIEHSWSFFRRCFNSTGRTVYSIISLWLLTYLVVAVYTCYTHIASVPGPPIAAYSRLWLSKVYSTGRLHQVYHETNRRYGPLARIGPNQVLLSDPEESMRILCLRSWYERGPWYDAFKIEPDRSNIVSQRHRPTHLHMRFQMAPGVYLVGSLR